MKATTIDVIVLRAEAKNDQPVITDKALGA